MSDALQHAPSFNEMVGLIKKLYSDYLEDVIKAKPEEIEKSWERYKTLNHLWQDGQPGTVSEPDFIEFIKNEREAITKAMLADEWWLTIPADKRVVIENMLIAYDQMVSRLSEGRKPGPVWVKATTRLPGIRAEVKWRIDGKEWEMKETPLGMWYNKPNDFHKYEWYDESGTAAGREEDAVAFAEWVSANFVGFYVGRELNHWYCPTLNGQEGKYTTAELYELFKQQKEKQ